MRNGTIKDHEYWRAYGAESLKLDLAFALVDARKKAELTQQQVADLTGVSQAYIAKLESGNANPTVGQVGAILGLLGLRAVFGLQPLVEDEDRVSVGQAPAS